MAAGATHVVIVLVTEGEGEVARLKGACAATRAAAATAARGWWRRWSAGRWGTRPPPLAPAVATAARVAWRAAVGAAHAGPWRRHPPLLGRHDRRPGGPPPPPPPPPDMRGRRAPPPHPPPLDPHGRRLSARRWHCRRRVHRRWLPLVVPGARPPVGGGRPQGRRGNCGGGGRARGPLPRHRRRRAAGGDARGGHWGGGVGRPAGRHLWYPSAAKRAAHAACRGDAAAMADLRMAMAEQVGGYQTLLAQNNCVGVGGGRIHGGKAKTRREKTLVKATKLGCAPPPPTTSQMAKLSWGKGWGTSRRSTIKPTAVGARKAGGSCWRPWTREKSQTHSQLDIPTHTLPPRPASPLLFSYHTSPG